MKICIDSDETGEPMKRHIVESLAVFEIDQMVRVPGSQYPDIAYRLAREIQDGNYERGILICGTGLGMAMMANKVSGVWAGTPQSAEAARKMARSNNANVLTIGCNHTHTEDAKAIVRAWLETPFEPRRNAQRMREIAHQ